MWGIQTSCSPYMPLMCIYALCCHRELTKKLLIISLFSNIQTVPPCMLLIMWQRPAQNKVSWFRGLVSVGHFKMENGKIPTLMCKHLTIKDNGFKGNLKATNRFLNSSRSADGFISTQNQTSVIQNSAVCPLVFTLQTKRSTWKLSKIHLFKLFQPGCSVDAELN